MEIFLFYSKHNYNTPTFTEEKEDPSCSKQYVLYRYANFISVYEMYVARHQVKKKRNIPNPFLVCILLLFWCMDLEAQVLFRVIDNLIPN